MVEMTRHIQGLTALRADLVEQRRAVVAKRGSVAAKSIATSVENWQRLIEAVDRAIADETARMQQAKAKPAAAAAGG
ncbi:hypothetical protein [Labrys wisconsinensis]|uniref:Uncharacterized protein n=1 Tax=Labrys wisconsinensis TaxID=425677 RepID=A0ABU0J4Y5_9HYPH|nr:hypothetical protein [Labrys wisconsinensis]MDQ0469330.1 hypothetical protein [Labrys wisconsinensis]